MEMITVTAKTVDDAITQASLQLGVSSDKLRYEVVEKEVRDSWEALLEPSRLLSVQARSRRLMKRQQIS